MLNYCVFVNSAGWLNVRSGFMPFSMSTISSIHRMTLPSRNHSSFFITYRIMLTYGEWFGNGIFFCCLLAQWLDTVCVHFGFLITIVFEQEQRNRTENQRENNMQNQFDFSFIFSTRIQSIIGWPKLEWHFTMNFFLVCRFGNPFYEWKAIS